MSKENGGAAFPSDTENYGPQCGMTLRDYFAAKALGFALVDPFVLAHTATLGPGASAEMLAEYTYRIADAMLAAREVSK